MIFFFDRNISQRIAHMIENFDRHNNVVHQSDDKRFNDTDDDSFIISTIRNDDPVTVWVTADISQKKRPLERAALRGSGMSVVFFKRFHNQSFHHQALKVLAVWPELCRLCETCRVPTAFEVPSGPRFSTKIDTLGPTTKLFA